MLPIVRRELQVAAWRRAAHWQRMIAAGAAMIVALLFVGLAEISPSAAGAALFGVLSWSAIFICMFEGIRAAGDAVARERREGTLGLLFLTDLRGHDVVLGKLSASAVKSFTLLLAVLPVFALPLLLGGVTSGETWRLMATLLLALLFSLSAGLLFSSVSTSALAALGGGFLFVTLVGLLPLPFRWFFNGSPFSGPGYLWMAGPFGMFLESGDLRFNADAAPFWRAAFYSAGLSMVMLAGACVAVRKVRLGETGSRLNSWWRRWVRPAAGGRKRCGEIAGLPQPGVWLAERMLPGRRVLWIAAGTGMLIGFVGGLIAGSAIWIVFVVQFVLGLLLKLWQAAITAHSMHAARQSGVLELLLCTPLTSRQIVDGQVKALSAYFIPPILVIALGLPLAALAGGGIAQLESVIETSAMMIAVGMVWILFFLLDLYALAYAGLWFGLTSQKAETAIAKTVFGVLLLPWLTMIVPLFGCFGHFVWPIFWIAWGSVKLDRHFRQKVARQYTGGEESWWPWEREKEFS